MKLKNKHIIIASIIIVVALVWYRRATASTTYNGNTSSTKSSAGTIGALLKKPIDFIINPGKEAIPLTEEEIKALYGDL